MKYTGHCLCGEVAFTIEGPLAPVQVCHCAQCRHAQGGPFATNIPVAASAFRLLRGAGMLKAFESSPGKERVFCSRCGSPVFSRRAARPEVLRIRAGLIEQPLEAGIAWHAHTGSQCRWWTIADELPQYPGAAPTSAPRS